MLPCVQDPTCFNQARCIKARFPCFFDEILYFKDRIGGVALGVFRTQVAQLHLNVAVTTKVISLSTDLVDLLGIIVAEIGRVDPRVFLQQNRKDRYGTLEAVLIGFFGDQVMDPRWHAIFVGMDTEFTSLQETNVMISRVRRQITANIHQDVELPQSDRS